MAISKKKRKKTANTESGGRTDELSNRKALAWVLAIPALGFGLFGLLKLDTGGPVEKTAAKVVSTSSYDHTTTEGTHQHTAAVVEVEGTTTTLQPADGAAPGGTLPVRFTRGRVTGQIKILGIDKPLQAPAGGSSPLVPVELPKEL